MTEKIDESVRKQVAEFAPDAIRKTIETYHHLADENADTKKIADRAAAGKIVVAHLQLLLKLAEWAGIDTGDDGLNAVCLLQAREEVIDFRDANLSCADDMP